ncbi:MTURN protein, partial [Polyodon spathula]|nr:MTURN protein [Polyodon spathula]
MDFKQLVDIGEKWCSGTPFDLIAAEENDERRLDFYAEPGLSFYVLCPDLSNGADNFVSGYRFVNKNVGEGKGWFWLVPGLRL